MIWEKLYRWIGHQEWLDRVDRPLSGAAARTFERAGPAEDVLHGKWLGHPLHPLLVTVPIGAWTAALVLDTLDTFDRKGRFGPGADALIGWGLAGALGSVAAGLADWRHTDGSARRIGLTHGLLNAGITGLMATSFLLRRSGARGPARAFSAIGFGATFVSAHLGGELIYSRAIGVTHANVSPPADRFTPVLPLADLPVDRPHRVEIDGTPIVLVRQGGQIHALAETCAHLGGPLAEGRVGPGTITCPWHGSTFDLKTGDVLTGPAVYPQPCFQTRIRDGQIEVRGARAGADSWEDMRPDGPAPRTGQFTGDGVGDANGTARPTGGQLSPGAEIDLA